MTLLVSQNTTLAALDAAIANSITSSQQRNYLGMSQIGKADERTLWFQFRNCFPNEHQPRVERIFRLGDAIESELIRYLRAIPNVQLVTDDHGKQFRFDDLGGHFSGAMDGAIVGIPEAPHEWHVFEAKSASSKRFEKLLKTTCNEWAPEYYAQVQCYMRSTGMRWALFCVYNKDDSRIHIERIAFDGMEADALRMKAMRIIEAPAPPPSKYQDKSWYEAKWMPPITSAIYWGERLPPSTHCKNCRFSLPAITNGQGAQWICRRANDVIPQHFVNEGCASHQWIPALVPLPMVAQTNDYTEYRLQQGVIRNGIDDFLSSELSSASINGFAALDDNVRKLRQELDVVIEDVCDAIPF